MVTKRNIEDLQTALGIARAAWLSGLKMDCINFLEQALVNVEKVGEHHPLLIEIREHINAATVYFGVEKSGDAMKELGKADELLKQILKTF